MWGNTRRSKHSRKHSRISITIKPMRCPASAEVRVISKARTMMPLSKPRPDETRTILSVPHWKTSVFADLDTADNDPAIGTDNATANPIAIVAIGGVIVWVIVAIAVDTDSSRPQASVRRGARHHNTGSAGSSRHSTDSASRGRNTAPASHIHEIRDDRSLPDDTRRLRLGEQSPPSESLHDLLHRRDRIRPAGRQSLRGEASATDTDPGTAEPAAKATGRRDHHSRAAETATPEATSAAKPATNAGTPTAASEAASAEPLGRGIARDEKSTRHKSTQRQEEPVHRHPAFRRKVRSRIGRRPPSPTPAEYTLITLANLLDHLGQMLGIL